MRMVRAIERNNWSSIGKCVQAYPHMRAFYLDARLGRIDGAKMRGLRVHADLLHRADLLDEMRSIHADTVEDHDHTQANRRSRVAAKSKNLKLGHCASVAVIQDYLGNILTDSQDIVTELRRHWQEVFSSSSVNNEILQRWYEEELGAERPWTFADPTQ